MKADAFAGGAGVLLYGKAGRNGSVRIVKRLLIGGMSRARQWIFLFETHSKAVSRFFERERYGYAHLESSPIGFFCYFRSTEKKELVSPSCQTNQIVA